MEPGNDRTMQAAAAARRGARLALAACVFAATWLLWSGHYTPLVLGLGTASCVLVLLLARRTGFFDVDVYVLDLVPRLPRYWWWLLGEIVRSNLVVARLVLNRRLVVTPTIVTVDAAHLPSNVQATLANAITLTPGTVTLDVDRGIIEVHCLTAEIAAELAAGEMLRRAERLTGD
jgi:multicomponent Na+:H+ antiporter subunit E